MVFLRRFIENHVLANLTFGLVIIFGVMVFISMPRAKDPDINMNWISIVTVLPGASSLEVEKRITDPIEEAISRTTKDLNFVSSNSRDGVSTLLVRFNELSEADFDQHVSDLRREIQNVYTQQLPDEALDPTILEVTTSTGFPTATIALSSETFNDDFRRYSSQLKKKLEYLEGIDSARMAGMEGPELRIAFHPERLVGLGISPVDLANTVSEYFRDVSVGDIETDQGRWIVKLEGTGGTLEDIENFPILGTQGVVTLGSIADIYRSAAEPVVKAQYKGRPAVMVSVTKQEGANVLEILDALKTFIDQENKINVNRGYQLVLIDDQTVSTREAISLMQNNALIGLAFVVLVSFLFLGTRISLLTSIGIPFTLAGTFLVINLLGMSVNNMVLLGIVIALGMLVDDAVVVVEAIYYRLQRGEEVGTAAIDSLREVFTPVLTSVMTTISVFLPLMFLEGIVGSYMRVIPIVVCVALAISLLEAFWMLPAHVMAFKVNFTEESSFQRRRRLVTRAIRHKYSLWLIKAFRNPRRSYLWVGAFLAVAMIILISGVLKVSFFASDPERFLYVNAELPRSSSLQNTLRVTSKVENEVIKLIRPEDIRGSISYSGQQFTDVGMSHGEYLGQVFVSLNPLSSGAGSVHDIVNTINNSLEKNIEGAEITVVTLEGGPPLGSPVNVKVRGDDFESIQAVTDKLRAYMVEQGLFSNISIDFKLGNPEMRLSLNGDAIKRAGLSPALVTRSLQSFVDGNLISQYQYLGEEVDVRLLASSKHPGVDSLLQQTIAIKDGAPIALSELVNVEYGYGYDNILHHNFQRAVTLSADIDTELTDTVTANKMVSEYWSSIQSEYPKVNLDYSGELDEIQDSLNGMVTLFVMGLGLIYLILGTQFKSYLQPFLVLVSVPLAFSGVVFGLTLTNNPLSLYSLYGVVALSGISVNTAIVLISAANDRLELGMSLLHATIYAARRRVIPVLITSLTTIAGLFSLAAGFAGKSLVWGPVATSIVSGMIFSTVLILFIVPLLYHSAARFSKRFK